MIVVLLAIVVGVPWTVGMVALGTYASDWAVRRRSVRVVDTTRLRMKRELGTSLSDRLPAKKRQRLDVVR